MPALLSPPPAASARHFLRVQQLNRREAEILLARAQAFHRNAATSANAPLRGRTIVSLFFENSTRTQASFEIAAKRMGAEFITMQPRASSVQKGETLLDTAATLNSMRADALILRHAASGAANLLARKLSCSVVNAGDGQHEHPTQALLDALTLVEAFGRLDGLEIAICGDILHSRVARSNVGLLSLFGARVRLVAPPTLLPAAVERWGAPVFTDMRQGISGCDVVMMLRLQTERMQGAYLPSPREFFRFYGLDAEKLRAAKPGAKVMHPGPMNRGVEIDSAIADDPAISLIEMQVEMGVAARMAVLESLIGGAP